MAQRGSYPIGPASSWIQSFGPYSGRVSSPPPQSEHLYRDNARDAHQGEKLEMESMPWSATVLIRVGTVLLITNQGGTPWSSEH